MLERKLKIDGMKDEASKNKVEKLLEEIPGVTSAMADLEKGEAKVSEHEKVREDAYVDALNAAGFAMGGIEET